MKGDQVLECNVFSDTRLYNIYLYVDIMTLRQGQKTHFRASI